jgi:2-polyprenyl-6-methoxyphenol hydroxylase-like FAD-dependent oxidoreductase
MSTDYDIITVGGGLGGAAFAKAMSERGYRVLVVERETKFKDRVRGEQMASWGAAEARELGIYDLLVGSCAQEMLHWNTYVGPVQIQDRDLVATTPHGVPNLTYFHPKMQEALLSAAADAGAGVRRGARVTGVEPGSPPSVTFECDGVTEKVTARLVAATGGRGSPVRGWAGFAANQDPERLQIAGLLFDDMDVDEEAGEVHINPITLRWGLVFPQGNGRVRTYITSRTDIGVSLHGDKDVPQYIEEIVIAGVDRGVMEKARPVGPLATFPGADSWVPHPYRDGVALIGDAAATSDPCWGQGLSLTVRDVRVLRDKLLADEDWDRAGHAYAEEHDWHYGAVRTAEDWFTELFYGNGPDDAARRGKALPLFGQEPDRVPDVFQSGPDDVTLDEAARRRFFAED